MSSEPPTYEAHLTTLGVDARALTVDSGGTLVTAPPALRQRMRLPVLRTVDADGDPADIRLAGLLGEGGMGRVLSADQVALGREVAVKVLHDDSAEGATDALLREALIAGRLEHPNVVPVYLLGRTAGGAPLFVMRRIEGVPWSAVLRDVSAAPGMFAGARDPLEFHLEVFLEVCGAVEFAHSRGIVHRDLKPDNVMLGAFREVYVVDWGLAVSLGDDPQLPLASEALGVVGTPSYMAPEMAAGNARALSPRTDVYLLGAVLHEVLVGTPPHHEGALLQRLAHAYTSPPFAYPAEVPADLAAVCHKAMRPDPAERYGSVDELRRAVRECVRHRSAWALSDEADRRARGLLAAIASADGPPAAVVHDTFAECRFGYRQSLAAWEGNTAAVDGLQRVVEAMVGYELSRDHPEEAGELLAQLPRPVAALTERVAAARAAFDARAARLAHLEHFHENADVTLGARTRDRVGTVVGGVWGGASLVVGWLQRTGRWNFTAAHGVAASVLFAVMCTGFVSWLRRRTPTNDIQGRFNTIILLCSWGFVNHWVMCWALDVPLRAALPLYLLWVAGGWILSAILYDKRFYFGGFALGAGALGAAVFPGAMFEVLGLSVLATYAMVLRAPRVGRSPAEVTAVSATRP